MSHAGDTDRVAVVARRCGHEDTRGGGIEERDLDRVDDELPRPRDRVVDDVDAVGNCVLDGGHEIDRSATGPAGHRVVPQHLVVGQAGGRSHAADVSDRAAIDGGWDVVVAGGGAAGVRAVTVEVTRRQELKGLREVGGVVPPGAQHFVVAGDDLLRARVAGAVPLGVDNRLVRPRLGQGAEARVLRPESGVDDSDDHTLAGARGAAKVLVPDAAGAGQPEEVWGRDGVDLDDLVLPDVGHTLGVLQLEGLSLRQAGGEAVQRGRQVPDLLALVDPRTVEHLTVLGVEIAAVRLRGRAVGLELLSLRGTRGGEARDVTVVRGHRIAGDLDDVELRGIGELLLGLSTAGCRQRERGGAGGDDGYGNNGWASSPDKPGKLHRGEPPRHSMDGMSQPSGGCGQPKRQ